VKWCSVHRNQEGISSSSRWWTGAALLRLDSPTRILTFSVTLRGRIRPRYYDVTIPGKRSITRGLIQGASQPWASECTDVKNYKRRLNPVWHMMLNSCTYMATVGVKGLKRCLVPYRFLFGITAWHHTSHCPVALVRSQPWLNSAAPRGSLHLHLQQIVNRCWLAVGPTYQRQNDLASSTYRSVQFRAMLSISRTRRYNILDQSCPWVHIIDPDPTQPHTTNNKQSTSRKNMRQTVNFDKAELLVPNAKL